MDVREQENCKLGTFAWENSRETETNWADALITGCQKDAQRDVVGLGLFEVIPGVDRIVLQATTTEIQSHKFANQMIAQQVFYLYQL